MESNTASLRELPPGGIWIAERKLWFSGVRLRSRMTVLRLADGRLWVHSASEPTPELCAELDRLGQVSWIVVPNRYHHLHASAMKARYPGAQVIGPASARSRNKAVVLDVAIDDERLPSLVPELSPVALRGVPFLDETLFFHAKTENADRGGSDDVRVRGRSLDVALGLPSIGPISAVQGAPGCALAYARRARRAPISRGDRQASVEADPRGALGPR